MLIYIRLSMDSNVGSFSRWWRFNKTRKWEK